MNAATSCLNPPSIQRVRYGKNFIKTVVCELRFPTILELENRPPREFQAKIRKAYPIYEPQTVKSPGELPVEHHYLFKSADQRWTVVVKNFAISLETSRYVDFDDFLERLRVIVRDATEMIDSNFLTRVGLRYINEIPVGDAVLSDWINPVLLGPISGPVLGEVQTFRTVLTGLTADGGYTLRHGVAPRGDGNAVRQYTLDFDFYKDGVELSDFDGLVQRLNGYNFGLFSWCIGNKAKTFLGEGKPK